KPATSIPHWDPANQQPASHARIQQTSNQHAIWDPANQQPASHARMQQTSNHHP
ncbi:hypothetical protein M9458_037630, partial [Cirrhinus mrigala]